MAEIKTDLIRLDAGDKHAAAGEEYVVTEKHTINDVVRWLVKMANGTEDIYYLLDQIDNSVN